MDKRYFDETTLNNRRQCSAKWQSNVVSRLFSNCHRFWESFVPDFVTQTSRVDINESKIY